MPRLSHRASAAVAALVVAVAAAATSLGSWTEPGDTSPTTVPSGARGAISVSGDTRPVPPGSSPAGAPPERAVLFVGRSPELNPRGGTAASFACRAAVVLGWRCQVRTDLSRGLPGSLTADVVVVTVVPRDDAARVARLLDGLPAGLAGARVVVLEPVVVRTDRATDARLAGIRRLAAARGALVVDPVSGRWLTAQTRRTYLTPDGDRLTAAGHEYVGGRLAAALRDSDVGA